MLNIDVRTHPVLASGKLILQKKVLMTISKKYIPSDFAWAKWGIFSQIKTILSRSTKLLILLIFELAQI